MTIRISRGPNGCTENHNRYWGTIIVQLSFAVKRTISSHTRVSVSHGRSSNAIDEKSQIGVRESSCRSGIAVVWPAKPVCILGPSSRRQFKEEMPRNNLIWVAAVVLSGLLIATAVGIDQKEVQSKLAQHQLYVSQSLSTSSWQIRNHIDRAVDDLMVFSRISDVGRLRMPETQTHLLEHFPAARSRVLGQITVCGSNRARVASAPSTIEDRTSACEHLVDGEWAWVMQASSLGEVKVTTQRRDPSSPRLRLLMPIHEVPGLDETVASSRSIGVLVGEMDLGPLTRRILDSLCFTSLSDAFLVGGDGVATGGRSGSDVSELLAALHLGSADAPGLSGGAGFAPIEWGREPQRQTFLVSWWPIQVGEERWLLLSASPRSEIIPFTQARFRTLASLVLAFVLIAATTLLALAQRDRQKIISEVAKEQERTRSVGELAWRSALLSEIVQGLRGTMKTAAIAETVVQLAGRGLDVSRCVLHLPGGRGSTRSKASSLTMGSSHCIPRRVPCFRRCSTNKVPRRSFAGTT